MRCVSIRLLNMAARRRGFVSIFDAPWIDTQDIIDTFVCLGRLDPKKIFDDFSVFLSMLPRGSYLYRRADKIRKYVATYLAEGVKRNES
ncbi:MAG: hypothetical protein Q6363_007855 [Candidatus Njordarchaeota archaeon]